MKNEDFRKWEKGGRIGVRVQLMGRRGRENEGIEEESGKHYVFILR